jgi:hypothetical protein
MVVSENTEAQASINITKHVMKMIFLIISDSLFQFCLVSSFMKEQKSATEGSEYLRFNKAIKYWRNTLYGSDHQVLCLFENFRLTLLPHDKM